MTAEPVLELDGIAVRYGGVPAVRGLQITLGRGEIVGLIGPNGAGKSTTLNAVMGLVPLAAVAHLDPVELEDRAAGHSAPR